MPRSSLVPILDPALEAAALATVAPEAGMARRRGIVLTPPGLALELARATLPESSRGVLKVLDPTCGTGRLLIAAARVARERGLKIELHGIEMEEALAAVARAALPNARIEVADAIDRLSATRPDVILLNPPYRGRMRTGNSDDLRRSCALKDALGTLLGPYSDPSTGFLLLSEAMLRPGGRLGAIVPVSIVSARDAAPAREHLARRCTTLSISSAPAPFEAQVHTTSIVLERRRSPSPRTCDWSSKLAGAAGVPMVEPPSDARIGDIAHVTADFRDEYYALRGHVVECADDPTAAPLVTCGLVDPGQLRHGLHPARIHRGAWLAPGVRRHRDIDAIVDGRRVPKVLVATQTRVLEAAADPEGRCMPLTPLIRVVPDAREDVWRIAASLLAPQATALALHRHFGAGRAPSTLRLRAADLAAMPLVDIDQPGRGALQRLHEGSGSLEAALSESARAWGGSTDGLLHWWWSIAPARLREADAH